MAAGTQQKWDTDVTTPLNASTLNTVAVAASCLYTPSSLTGSNVTTSGSSLVVGMPALTLVVNPGTTGGGSAPQYLSVSAGNVTVGSAGNTTYYIYLSSGGSYTSGTAATSTGLATIVSVVTNSSGTGVVSVAQVITPYGLGADDVGAATGTSISGFTYTALKTVGDQIRALGTALGSVVDAAARSAINTLTGTTFGTNTKKAVLEDGTNADSSIALPAGMTVGGMAPILSDGTNSGTAVSLAGTLKVNGKQYSANYSSSTAPRVAAYSPNASAASIAGTDEAGQVSFTAAINLTSGGFFKLGTVTFGGAYSDTYSTSSANPKSCPIVLLSAQDGSGLAAAAAAVSTTSFDVFVTVAGSSAITSGTTTTIAYLVIG